MQKRSEILLELFIPITNFNVVFLVPFSLVLLKKYEEGHSGD